MSSLRRSLHERLLVQKYGQTLSTICRTSILRLVVAEKFSKKQVNVNV